MIISYQGVESFKISQGDLVLALNPISKDSKFKSTNFGADITLVSLNHPDTNGSDQTARGDKKPFVITGPGEYEVKDVAIKGLLSESHYGATDAKGLAGKGKINTIYYISFEGMNLCYLGALGNPKLTTEALEALKEIDILFVPIAGDGVLDSMEAYKLAVSLEPKVIIPMHYSAEHLKQFVKEGGGESVPPLDKLVIKKKDLESKKSEIVVLKEE
jgi:L-ascorbate metabolism protein UlaG (beta-lactamase superfamily)